MSERNATTTQPDPYEDRPSVPSVQCKPWCEYQDGHPKNWCREDQWCGSKQLTVDLHHIQSEADPVSGFAYNYLVTYVMQTPGQDPEVHLGLGEDSGWTMTIDESVSLALALLDQAERVRRNADAHDSLVGVPIAERSAS